MNCHQQRSKLVRAAVFLGGQGKKHIEATKEASVSGAENITTFPTTSYPLELSSGILNRDLNNNNRKVESISSSNNSQVVIKQENDVEIVAGPELEGVRTDLDEQATECSSSFGYSGDSDAACDGPEVDSGPRNGNAGASEGDKLDRKKRPLNMDWKNYRKEIEWRCRWLDLRLMELNRQSTKYEQAISNMQQTQRLQASMQPDVGSSRACPLPEGAPAQPVLHRQRRRKIEEPVDMTKHPLFSRYEKKKRGRAEFDLDTKQPDYLFEQTTLAECARAKQEDMELDAMAEPDSLEQVLWKIESCHRRLGRIKNVLKSSMQHKRGRPQNLRNIPRPGRPLCPTAGAGSSKGTHSVRRRASDFDINNVVMPVSVGSKVEHIKHANIETPQWRHLSSKPNTGNVEPRANSEENTDDETYQTRHAPLEIRERRNRCVPRSVRKTSDGDVSCSRSKQHYGGQ